MASNFGVVPRGEFIAPPYWLGLLAGVTWGALAEAAVAAGVTFFDTAWGYGRGASERILGRLVRARPERRLFTASKIPPKNFAWPSQRGFTLDDCFPPDHIREYTEKSLENLGLPRRDLM